MTVTQHPKYVNTMQQQTIHNILKDLFKRLRILKTSNLVRCVQT